MRAIGLWAVVLVAGCQTLDNFTLSDAAADSGAGAGPDGGSDAGPDAGPDAGRRDDAEVDPIPELPLDAPPPVDVLFVIDNSGSMDSKQRNIATNFDSFIGQIAPYADYRIAVVTTDMDSNPGGLERDGRVTQSFRTEFPSGVIANDTSMCRAADMPHGCFRGPNAALRIIDSRKIGAATQIAKLQDNVQVGTCGSGTEQGFAAALAALTDEGPNHCNAGFLRASANLLLIFVSDEEESSMMSPEAFVNALVQLKDPAKIRVATISGYVNGRASSCRGEQNASCGHSVCDAVLPEGSLMSCVLGSTTCPAGEYCGGGPPQCRNVDTQFIQYCFWCSFYNAPDCCEALAGARYDEAARLLEQRVIQANPTLTATSANCQGTAERVACLEESICQADFGPALQRIARRLIIDQAR